MGRVPSHGDETDFVKWSACALGQPFRQHASYKTASAFATPTPALMPRLPRPPPRLRTTPKRSHINYLPHRVNLGVVVRRDADVPTPVPPGLENAAAARRFPLVTPTHAVEHHIEGFSLVVFIFIPSGGVGGVAVIIVIVYMGYKVGGGTRNQF